MSDLPSVRLLTAAAAAAVRLTDYPRSRPAVHARVGRPHSPNRAASPHSLHRVRTERSWLFEWGEKGSHINSWAVTLGDGRVGRHARGPRHAPGGVVFEVLNRGAGRATISHKPADCDAFEHVMAEALARRPGVRLLAC